jgi:endogenous inhibitor of DNA gyrase (YacG/DUF329 family)
MAAATAEDAHAAPRGKRRCPICGKEPVEKFAPFCSKRCADIDLHRWLSGAYAIPAVEADDDASEEGDGGKDG